MNVLCTVQTLETAGKESAMEVMILVECGSELEYEMEKQFAANLISSMAVGQNRTAVSVVLYGNETQVLIDNAELTSFEELNAVISNITNSSFVDLGHGNLSAALQSTQVQQFALNFSASTTNKESTAAVRRANFICSATPTTSVTAEAGKLLATLSEIIPVTPCYFGNATTASQAASLAILSANLQEESIFLLENTGSATLVESTAKLALTIQEKIYPGENSIM